MLDDQIIQYVVRNTGMSDLEVQELLSVVERSGTHTIVRIDPKPRKLRCKQCKNLKPSEEINEQQICGVCSAAPTPDDRAASVSVSAYSGGLPSLGRR